MGRLPPGDSIPAPPSSSWMGPGDTHETGWPATGVSTAMGSTGARCGSSGLATVGSIFVGGGVGSGAAPPHAASKMTRLRTRADLPLRLLRVVTRVAKVDLGDRPVGTDVHQ